MSVSFSVLLSSERPMTTFDRVFFVHLCQSQVRRELITQVMSSCKLVSYSVNYITLI